MRDRFDALVWAEQFTKQFHGATIEHSNHDVPDTVDTGTMIGWFANYGMLGYDLGMRHQRDREERLTLALKRGWTYPQYIYAEEHGYWDEKPGDGTEEPVDTGLRPPLGDSTEYEDLPSYPRSNHG